MWGTLALLAGRGIRVHLLTATRGVAGSCGDAPLCLPAELAIWREKEIFCACRAAGLQPLTLMDYRDGHLSEVNPVDIIEQIVRKVRALRPQAMLSFGP